MFLKLQIKKAKNKKIGYQLISAGFLLMLVIMFLNRNIIIGDSVRGFFEGVSTGLEILGVLIIVKFANQQN
ncbi:MULTISPECIES: hypothetical protein [Thermoanaerobacterium]|uniref:Uncharacterized protein n=2 Tax=Thermoanaerobacterium TaxID=28895 RepID=W9EBL1_9THEO|nr:MULTISPECIES: hypothetical protein [Thermoanaerobacterium]AFK85508.1 hypothetical protein Tsac_0482 [Thermoanaerobacterium saccharolyticum JW/SL-YS485]ETO37184.1 hypothetical protein V518_2661 [Thermoanaerobacterium aotearoense SCUT27]